ncbi:unnamed protein product, partial [Oikopleura dioica]
MLQQDPVYIKRFIVKSTDEFLNLHHKQEGNEKANPKSLRGMAAVVSEAVSIDTRICEEFANSTRREHSPADVRESCCDSFSIRLDDYPNVSGTFSRIRKTVNNRPIWKNRAFGLWANPEGNWMIGSLRSIGKKRGFLVAKNSTNCPNKLETIFDAKTQKIVKIHTSCDCCEILTIKGASHVQNSKYGIYVLSKLSKNQGEYRQIWPETEHGNVIYKEDGRYYISDRPRSTVGHLGIFSDRTRGCPSEAKGWKSWIGFDKVITDSEFKISCFSGDSKCIHAHDFCKSRENQKLCKNSIFQCQ